MQRLRHQLREYFPAALEAFEDLDAPDALELLGKAPEPARAARLTRAQVSAALKRARRRNIADRATAILAALRGEHLGQPAALTAAYAATVRSLIAVIAALNEQVKILQGQVEEHFGRHPDAEIYRSQPGTGSRPRRPGARRVRRRPPPVHRGRRPAGTTPAPAPSPAPRARRRSSPPGSSTTTGSSTPSSPGPSPSLNASPGARAFYDQQRAKGLDHNDALRRLANRLVGILHGCLKTRTLYDETTAWGHRRIFPLRAA